MAAAPVYPLLCQVTGAAPVSGLCPVHENDHCLSLSSSLVGDFEKVESIRYARLQEHMQVIMHLVEHEMNELFPAYSRFVQFHRAICGGDPDPSDIATVPCLEVTDKEGCS